ncbi:TonB-dependent receptor [Agarilytica rhodophyticola]|uniref:TonB-dependent receptor n=1 Tax=Agarilytica rhodophyticola TaxID=1737490 RepID=UPI000B3464B1|nr:TonB-dependent receptor [Agarilytica rhodophyticola]
MIKSQRFPQNANSGVRLSRTALSVAVATVLSGAVHAQSGDQLEEEVIVTGIRASLQSSMNTKRDAQGVVDAINAEDIGKFPTSNLAESLQRIPGVSINRVNNEGSQITVRGFGPGFNQVTLNGRTLPTADVPLVGGDGRNTGGDSRAFDFSNLSSDGVKTLEVYKSGAAHIASGGIGATVNIVTRRPLENPGFQATISGKGIIDTSVDRGDSVTPDLSGAISWTNEDDNFGVALNISHTERDSAAPSANSASWNVVTYREFLGFTNADTQITNAPTDLDQLVTLPRDSRYQFSEFTSERTNGQLVLQYEPTDNVRLTTDYTFSVNENQETNSQVSNWFNRPFSEVVFDNSPVPTTVFLREVSTNQDAAMQQSFISTKDELQSLGFNAEIDLSDSFVLTFDAHSSSAEVSPNGPLGYSSINVGIGSRYGGAVGEGSTVSQAVDYSGDIPIQIIETVSGTADVNPALAASQVSNNNRIITQENDVDQFDIRGDWQIDDSSKLSFGMNYRSQTNLTDSVSQQQILGNWGGENRGDIEQLIPGALETYCLSCRFNDHSIGGATLPGAGPSGFVEGLRGNAAQIFEVLSPFYAAGFTGVPGTVFENDLAAGDRTLNTTSDDVNEIEEDVLALFAQFTREFQIAGNDASLTFGLRYEDTEVTSTTSSLPTASVIWQGNNDFTTVASTTANGITTEASYDHLLPNVDFAVDLTDEIKFRSSYSKTIARPAYSNLFASVDVQTPSGPLALNDSNRPIANSGNPELVPLESDNVDVSLEWYFNDSSYVSIGGFDKRVRNFVGRETIRETVFGLRDASSGDAGTRSGDAVAILENLGVELNEDNLFAATVYVDQEGSVAAAQARFVANQGADGNIDGDEYNRLETNEDVAPNADDPEFEFAVNRPVNNREAKINGIEIQGQHFFGETGFGVAGSYTFVDGDVGIDVTGAPDVTQFALEGLSDTANLTLIYEKFGISARLAYNWRDEFLAAANDGSGFNNPVFVEEYGQLDLSLGYDITDNLSVSLDAINLNEETTRTFTRAKENLLFLRENAARYFVGVRYKF